MATYKVHGHMLAAAEAAQKLADEGNDIVTALTLSRAMGGITYGNLRKAITQDMQAGRPGAGGGFAVSIVGAARFHEMDVRAETNKQSTRYGIPPRMFVPVQTAVARALHGKELPTPRVDGLDRVKVGAWARDKETGIATARAGVCRRCGTPATAKHLSSKRHSQASKGHTRAAYMTLQGSADDDGNKIIPE